MSSQIEGVANPAVAPVCFIEHVNGVFRVTSEAKALLSKVTGKIAVVCVAGPYRTGKSFLLNKLIGTPKGFKVGSTIRACTKGIWLWGEPVTKDGCSYLFMDTEGLGSTDQTLPYDTQIFSLSVLLSSFFILNTQGTINEQALNELELVVNCANQIRLYDTKDEEMQKAGSSSSSSSVCAASSSSNSSDSSPYSPIASAQEETVQSSSSSSSSRTDQRSASSTTSSSGTSLVSSKSDLAAVFPSFLWVLRDFSLRLRDDENNAISASEYLEMCLTAQKAGGNRASGKNRTREVIKSVFLHRDCRTLVRPVVDEDQLQDLPSISSSNFRPEFMKQLESLCSLIFASARPKQIHGGLLNGLALVGLAEAYTHAMNSGGMPVIYSAWEAVVLTQASQAIEGALSTFTTRLNALCPRETAVEREALEEAFMVADQEALQALRAVCVGDEQTNRGTEAQLLAKLLAIKKERVVENSTLSQSWCQALLLDLWPDEKEVAEADLANLVQRTRDAYEAKARGPCKELVYHAFLEKKFLLIWGTIITKVDQLTSELQDTRQRFEQAQQENQELQSQVQQTQHKLDQTERLKQKAESKQTKALSRVTSLGKELQVEREKNSELLQKEQTLLQTATTHEQEHKQQLERLETSCRVAVAEAQKQQSLANDAHTQERLQLTSSLEKHAALAREQQEQLSHLHEQLSRLETEKHQREAAATTAASSKLEEVRGELRRHQRWSSVLGFLFSAEFFFSLFVIVLCSRFELGPDWL